MKLCVCCLAALLMAPPLLAVPADLETAYQSLKAATEAKKDAAEIKKLAAEAYALAHPVSSAPAPDTETEKEAWTTRVAHAREIETYSEYALYSAAVRSPAAVQVDLFATLEQQNPKSKYFDEGYARYFAALNQMGEAEKIPAIAEKGIANLPNNADLLLVLANLAMNRKQSDRAIGYAQRLVAALEQRSAKPETMSAADWERKRNSSLGRGHWIAGVLNAEKASYAAANKELRAALPLIKGNEDMLATALYYLGLANYQIGRLTLNKAQVLEAAKFSEQAGAMNSPLAAQARHNALAMRNEAIRMR